VPTTVDVTAGPRPAPFLRWAGGKRRLLPVLTAGAPAAFSRYFEPFLGGGAMLFALDQPGSFCVVNDANEDLALTYRVLRDDPEALIAALHQHEEQVSSEWFYALRAVRPVDPVARAARFIAYNRTSFNGLFRVNSSGGWNTPYGKLKNPTVCNAPLLRAVSDALAGADIRSGSFQDATKDADVGDFVYLDPPYLPLSPTSSFSQYAAGGFGVTDHQDLAAVVAAARDAGALVMLSNSDTPLTREIFAGMDLYQVQVRRSISANASSREQVAEILAVTYPVEEMRDPDAFLALATPLSH
jgi:DNA adenine methylase